MTNKIYSVPDVSCGHCKASIEKALGTLEGVGSVEVDVAAKKVQVSFDESRVSETVITDMLAEEGYPVGAE